jgi:hypothetical protein
MSVSDAAAEGSGSAGSSATGVELREVNHHANTPRTTTDAATKAMMGLLPERPG